MTFNDILIPKVGTKWDTHTGKQFVVEKLEYIDNNVWIHYAHGDSKYNCLVEAFVHRFRQAPE